MLIRKDMKKTTKPRNYTTTIPSSKSTSQLEAKLWDLGCHQITKTGDGSGAPTGIEFAWHHAEHVYAFRMEVNYESVLSRLQEAKVPKAKQTKQHAINVAWRTLSEMVLLQVEGILNGTLSPQEAWGSYMVLGDGKTIQQHVQGSTMPDVKLLMP